MILTRIKLNLTSPITLKALANREVFHAALARSRQATDGGRLLWRIDELRHSQYLLVTSQKPLNVELLENQFGVPGKKAEQKDYDTLLNRISKDSVWHFKLVANPTFTAPKAEGEKSGKRKPCYTEKYQLNWLLRQSEKNGFEITGDSAKVMKSIPVFVRKRGEQTQIQLQEVTYQGVLKVKDVELFKNALTQGIGREKAYGMGLLTIIGS